MSPNSTDQYWKDPEYAGKAESGNGQVPWTEDAPGEVSRRNFLRAAGFTAAIAAAGCSKAPVDKALPLVTQAEGMAPARSRYYASVCGACEAGCGALVKSRDGRPIKLEGLPDHPLSRGGLCAVGQAALLGLYDSHRFTGPQREGQACDWLEIDRIVLQKLDEIRTAGGAVRLLTSTVTSPTLNGVIARFLARFPDARHLAYDPLSCSAILDAHADTHGIRVLPRYRFDRSDVIVSFDADFLGTWISPVEYAAGYRERRRIEDKPETVSFHVQFESRMSLTGTNADLRYRVAPNESGTVLSVLADLVAARLGAGGAPPPAGGLNTVPAKVLEDLAARLVTVPGKSLIISGSQDIAVQRLCNTLNHILGNYGSTLDIAEPSYQKQGRDSGFVTLLDELTSGKVNALIVAGVNPVYELPEGQILAESLDNVDLVVYCGERPNETSGHAGLICPDHHFLESWGDVEAVCGIAALRQPLIRPLFNTRSLLDSLNVWAETPASAYDAIQGHWQEHIHPRTDGADPFQTFWDRTLHDGWARVKPETAAAPTFRGAGKSLADGSASQDDFTLIAYPKIGLLDGRHAYNPWLQELPDPVSKVTWDNYACLSVAAAKESGVKEGDIIRIEGRGLGDALELPAHIQPGQHDRVVAVALGYGQETTGRFANIGPQWILSHPSVGGNGLVGIRVHGLLVRENGCLRYERTGLRVTRTGETAALASTQTHHTITVPERLAPAGGLRRPIIQETTLDAYRANPHSGSHAQHDEYKPLFPDDHPKHGHHWAMAIDLTACTGCSACVIACQAENNVPVVGKDEVRRRREMHWLRIDRYYSGEGDEIDVVHQPMLCHHCDNAPCENVCPVLATVHTQEGLNAQVYNRCVGTRYCENNCPYKVRRFNWFRYRYDDPVENLALNPDVTVRSRGIMEKCSFCVQRIQDAKYEAKRRQEPLVDGVILTACQQSCPTQAIVFGDLNDPESLIARLVQSPRHFRVLEEIDVRPSVGYLTLVRNRMGEREVEHHG
ncbi:MAG: 4Fe-4S dicluster domain-containing protein [Candidatus Hydrogenedentes bacterium]|nr:4Fe-4S dicluster domain-containing protein [Candidatus Hydrogenedentota bacterium]